MNNTTVKKQLKNPNTGKRAGRVFISTKGWYVWNTVFHVYNAARNYEQLKEADLKYLVWPGNGTTIPDGLGVVKE